MNRSTNGGIMSEVLLSVLVGIIAVCIASLLLNKVFFRSLQPSSKVRETVTQTPVNATPEERTLVKAAVSNNVEADKEREREKAEREKAQKEKAEKEKAEKEKADKEQAQKEKEARQLLMEQARQTFMQKDDPQFKSDEDLQKVANTVAGFNLKCPTISECRELVQLCKKLEEKQYDSMVLAALKGSEYIFQQEIDMANAGYHKWGKVWLDDKQFAQLRQAASAKQQTQPTTTGPFSITVSHVRGYRVIAGKTLVNDSDSGSGTVVVRPWNDFSQSTVGPAAAGPTVALTSGYQINYTLSNSTKTSQVAVVSLSMDHDADTLTYNLGPGATLIGTFASKSNARNIIVSVNGKSQLFFITWSNAPQ
jgi:hypothetical protein